MYQYLKAGLGRWRLLAAVLVALGLVLPLSKCTQGNPPAVEYHYVLNDSAKNPSCVQGCRVASVSVTLAAFLWPLVAWLSSLAFGGRTGTLTRLVLEFFLIGGSTWWLYWEFLMRSPALGGYATIVGLLLYLGIWCVECARMRAPRPA